MNLPAPGQERSALETPVLMVNLDLFEANIQTMAAHCRKNGKTWRPHSKAHKSPAIARFLLENGASGITCAKLGEAELMAQHGIESILLANQIVTPSKLKTLAQLQRQAEIIAAIDHISVVEPMGKAATKEQTVIPVVVEIDIYAAPNPACSRENASIIIKREAVVAAPPKPTSSRYYRSHGFTFAKAFST